jgi:hypothetical protein
VRESCDDMVSILLPLLATILHVFIPTQDKLIETDHYSVQVPSAWDVKRNEGPGPEFSFDATKWLVSDGKTKNLLPAMHNGAAVTASGFIAPVASTSSYDAAYRTTRYFRSIRDRYFAMDTFIVETFTLADGTKASYVKTRLGIMSRNLDMTRYDLFVYNEKLKYSHHFSIAFGYIDPKYELEKRAELDLHVAEVFRGFRVKK